MRSLNSFCTSPFSRAVLRMHCATFLFGLSAIFGALATCPAPVLVCGRALFAVGALGLVACCRCTPLTRGLSGRELRGMGLSGLLLTLHYVSFFMAIQRGGVAVGTLGFACFPAFVTAFEAIAFKERPKRHEYVLLVLVTGGLLLITPSFTLQDSSTVGLLWGIISGAVYAVLAVLNRVSASRISGVQAAWLQNVVMLCCLLPFTATAFPALPVSDWLWIACLGIFCTAVAYTLYVDSLTALKARLAALIIALEPVYAILLAWILFGEQPGLRMCAGALLILGAVLWSGLRR